MREIIGNTTATPNPKPDWNQTDETKADYIKNKPDYDGMSQKISIIESKFSDYDDLNSKIDGIETKLTGYDEMNTKIEIIESQMADLLYTPISVSSFSHNVGTKEIGQIVTELTLSWKINKTPTQLMLNGDVIDVYTTSKIIGDLSITWDNNKTWTLVATDDRGATSTKSTSITFCNRIYYGVGTQESDFNSDFVTSLSGKQLSNNKAYDFTVNPTSQYIYYAVPTRLGTVSFKVGGFEGGFEAPVTVSVTNSSGYTENYYVYRSTNQITGSTSVDVI